LTLSDLKRAILEIVRNAAPGQVHKINLIGRPYQPGGLEYYLDVRFDADQRVLAARAFDELRASGLTRPTYGDSADPENWVEITDAGLEALVKATYDLAEAKPEPPREREQKFGILSSPGQAERDFKTWTEANRQFDRPVAIIFLDIDHFKALNTKFTETTVDEAILGPFQQLLVRICSGRGEAYRHGGDEFLVLLRNCGLREAGEFAERLRTTLAEASFPVGEEAVRVTISAGAASWPAHGDLYRDVLRAANVAKAKAKEARNSVRLASLNLDTSDVEPAGAPPFAIGDEIETAIRWFESNSADVRRDAAGDLLRLVFTKRVFNYEPVRGAIRRLLKDEDQEVRIRALEIHTALMQWERATVRRYYAQTLIGVAEQDPSLTVRARAMSAIGATRDSYYCARIYVWITQWPYDVYRQVYPVTALIGLAHTGLRAKIRDDLRSLLEQALDPQIKTRLVEALDAIRS